MTGIVQGSRVRESQQKRMRLYIHHHILRFKTTPQITTHKIYQQSIESENARDNGTNLGQNLNKSALNVPVDASVTETCIPTYAIFYSQRLKPHLKQCYYNSSVPLLLFL